MTSDGHADHQRVVFVLGAPRSGTTWTSHLLARHPAVATVHHANLFPFVLAPQSWGRDKRLATITAGGEDVPDTPLADVITDDFVDEQLGVLASRLYAAMAASASGTTTIVDHGPENVRIARAIHRALPDAHFVHVIRDPRAVFSSQRSASRGWATYQFATRSFDGARQWCRDVELGRAIAGYSDHYHEVRYEELEADGPATLTALFRAVGLDATDELVGEALRANTKSRMRQLGHLPDDYVRADDRPTWMDELSRSTVARIESIAGSLMAELGYETVTDGSSGLLGALERPTGRLIGAAEWLFRKQRVAFYLAVRGRRPGFELRIRSGDQEL